MPRKKTGSKATGGLTFLVSTDLEKPDPNTRKFIRSHVMVGKNAGRKLPSRKREQSSEESSPSQDDSVPPETLPICRRFASSRSAIVLADTVEPGELTAVLQLSFIAKQLLFALEPVIFFERRNEDWINPLTTDAAYLHCQVFNSQFFLTSLQRRNTGLETFMTRQTISHYTKALRLLSERLESDDESLRLSNSTLATMTSLAIHAMVIGNLSTAGMHIYGMCQIIQARGGTKTFFGGSEKLLGEILRVDLGLALTRGSKPVFATVIPVEEPLLQYPDLGPLLKAQNLVLDKIPLGTTNEDPLKAWNTMADFCKLINFAAATEHRITTVTFLHTMTATMYRLLSSDVKENPRDEIIRLSLLAFSSSTFLPWRSLGVSYVYLASVFNKHFARLIDTAIPSKLELWAIMIAAMSLLDESDDGWVQPFFVLATETWGVKKWEDIRDLMHEFLWIDLIHNEPGRAVFERLMGCNAP